MPGLFQALLGTRNLDLVARVLRSWNLNFGSRFEFQLLELFPIFANDKTMVFLGNSHSR